jgi:hypothetical protein
MKAGSKSYLIFTNKMESFGLAFFFFGITIYFIHLSMLSSILMILGVVLFSIAKVINMFNPVFEEYEWEKVYPELNDNEL